MVAGVHRPVAQSREAFELPHVAAAAAGDQQVAAGHGGQDVLGAAPRARGGSIGGGGGLVQGEGDQFAQLQDVGLQGGADAARGAARPQFVDQGGHRDHPVGVQRQQREDLAGLGRGGRDRHPVLPDIQCAQYVDLHAVAPSVGVCRPSVPRVQNRPDGLSIPNRACCFGASCSRTPSPPPPAPLACGYAPFRGGRPEKAGPGFRQGRGGTEGPAGRSGGCGGGSGRRKQTDRAVHGGGRPGKGAGVTAGGCRVCGRGGRRACAGASPASG